MRYPHPGRIPAKEAAGGIVCQPHRKDGGSKAEPYDIALQWQLRTEQVESTGKRSAKQRSKNEDDSGIPGAGEQAVQTADARDGASRR